MSTSVLHRPRVVIVAGLPGTGKTTIMRRAMHLLGGPQLHYEYGLVQGHAFPEQKTLVLGLYANRDPFAGTDLLTTRINWTVPAFFQHFCSTEESRGWSVLGEGQRILSHTFFDTVCALADPVLVVVECDGKLVEQRRHARKSAQQESWLKGVKTRLDNMVALYEEKMPVLTHTNTTVADVERIARFLVALSTPSGVEEGAHG